MNVIEDIIKNYLVKNLDVDIIINEKNYSINVKQIMIIKNLQRKKLIVKIY